MKSRATYADLQDGKPSKGDGQLLLHSLSMIAQGHTKDDIHKEKSMNDVRHSLGLYLTYTLANDLLAGSLKR